MPDEARRITPDRRHSLTGKKNLDWFFANRKWVRTAGNSVVEAAWAKRELPPNEAAIRFLFLAAKRSYKRAHDRNRIKRWLRAAVSEIGVFSEIEDSAIPRNQQVLVMLRVSKPMREVEWNSILYEVGLVGEHILKRALPASAEPLVLVKKSEPKTAGEAVK